MALELLHTFITDTPQTIQVWFDPDTNLVEATANSDPVEDDATEAEYGLPAGHLFRYDCNGTTKREVRAIHTNPFAEVIFIPDSTDCGFTPPGCTQNVSDIVVTNESVAGANDGTATINATALAEYSLDGVTYQTDNYFFGLPPGNYIGYAKFSPTCIDFMYFTILAGPSVAVIAYPWQEILCKFFRLLVPNGIGGYTTYNIREPFKWDQTNFIGKRDKEWHGYRGMFSDGIAELEFDCDSGMEQILAEYETFGNDAEVKFQYGYTYLAIEYFLFLGKLNFNTMRELPGRVAISVEKEDFNNLFQTRFDTKVSMAETIDMDGGVITPPAVIDFVLHAKEIVRSYSTVSSDLQTYSVPTTSNVAAFYFQPDTSAPQLDEIETSYGYPLGISTINPVTELKYNWDLKYSGLYDFTINYHLSITFRNQAVPSGTWTLKSFFRIVKAVGVNDTQIGATISGSNSVFPQTVTTHPNQTFTGLDLVAGDKVYFFTELAFSNTVARSASVDQHSTAITAQSLENAGDSDCRGWLIGEAVNHCIKSITGNQTRLRSSFLQTTGFDQAYDGAGSLYIVTNGKQIRAFDVANAPLKISLKELLSSSKSIHCLGYGFEKIGAQEVVRVERVNYFYRNKEILVVEDPSEYREEVAKDIIYNEVETGYDKYQDSGFNTLDEFNTKHEYLTPIKTNKLKTVIKSTLIASGYSIETSRREQFADTATDSFQNDDDGFIIAVRRGTGNFIPEKDEAFDVVNNLISPSTAYNLRISPLRMLLNWAIWLKGIFFYKLGADEIKNTFVAHNGAMETQFLPAEVNPVGDINKLLWREDQAVSMTNYAVEEQLYRPEWIYFKCRLTPDKIHIINESMTGNYSSDTDYGFITVKDHNGDYQAGFLYELEYNYSTEAATFKLLKKWNSPVTPGEGCCEYLVVNGCYIKINGLKTVF